jgi:hypothetical protein
MVTVRRAAVARREQGGRHAKRGKTCRSCKAGTAPISTAKSQIGTVPYIVLVHECGGIFPVCGSTISSYRRNCLLPSPAPIQRQNCGASMLGQRVVAASMSEGHFARHVKRMRLLCAARRKALAQACRCTSRKRPSSLEACSSQILAWFGSPIFANQVVKARRLVPRWE